MHQANAAVIRLADGGMVRLRAARAADVDGLRRMFYRLSDTTRYLYFCAGVPSNEHWAAQVSALGVADGQRSYALVAEDDDGLVAVARFDVAAEAATAEVGILVADGWQSRGLGGRIIAWLAEQGRLMRLAAFTGQTLGDNVRALRLLRRAFPGLRVACSLGVCALLAPLDPPPTVYTSATP